MIRSVRPSFCSSAGLLALAVMIAGCGPRPILDRDWPDAYWRHGPYVLLAVDTEAEMSLSLDTPVRGVSVAVVRPTVFAVGADAHYVVVQQHPCADGVHFDRAVTNFFVVDRADDSAGRTPRVIGPLSSAEFERFGRTAALPAFSLVFPALEWQRTGE